MTYAYIVPRIMGAFRELSRKRQLKSFNSEFMSDHDKINPNIYLHLKSRTQQIFWKE